MKMLFRAALALLFMAPCQALAQGKIAAPAGVTPAQGQCFGAVGDDATCVDANHPLPTTPISGGGTASGIATYRALATGYAGYASATDLLCIWGSSSKTVVVFGMGIAGRSTSSTLVSYDVVKRSTANSGGTPSSLTAVPFDSADSAATASVVSYGAAPTLGTTVGVAYHFDAATAVLTGNSAYVGPFIASTAGMPSIGNPGVTSFNKSIVLHGTGQGLCLNQIGVSSPSGAAAHIVVEFGEYTPPS